MGNQERSRIAPPLAHRVGADANPTQIADAVVATWQEIDSTLTPIIGHRGVAALYRRSRHLAASIHPWLASAHDDTQATMNFATLESVLTQQSSAEAATGGAAHLQTFHELLTALVGPLLTERLLRSVWANPSSGLPAQETSR
jgi:hypothetical protein